MVQIDKENGFFNITGDVSEFQSNKMLLLSLNRLHPKLGDDAIRIPYEENSKIATLREIQEILEEYGVIEKLSEQTAEDVGNYTRELENFEVFSEKARLIRNNQFQRHPELIDEFKAFQEVISRELVRTLKPLQLLSSYHLAFAQNGCNFSVPGSGKTTIVYATYAYLKNLPQESSKHVDKLLVVGPLSSFNSWEVEYRKCFHLEPDTIRLSGDSNLTKDEKKQHFYSANPSEITLMGHGAMEIYLAEIKDFLKQNKTLVVIDEAHKIKNHQGHWGKSSIEISKEAKARVILTGTPAPNGYQDLYNLFKFIYPYKFKDIFNLHYGNLVEMTKYNSHYDKAVNKFIKDISPYFLRIRKSDLNLPPINETKVSVPMDNLQSEIYRFVEEKYVNDFRISNRGNIKNLLNKAKLIRLRQAATNPGLLLKAIEENVDYYEGISSLENNLPSVFETDSDILLKIKEYSENRIPEKIKKTKEIVSQIISEDSKVIIWTIFIGTAKLLQGYLKRNGIQSKLLIGEVELSEREAIVNQFNNPDDMNFKVVIANPFSVSESISLHKGCHNAIYLERDYNCANFLQSKDRIHRLGLEEGQETNYYYMLTESSIDEIIDKRIEEKVKLMESIMEQEIPLFTRINDSDETDIIMDLMKQYDKRS